MKRLEEVETAKQLMNDAVKWSVMTWLREKKRVRKTADEANAALDRLSDEVRQRWPENIRNAYQLLVADGRGVNANGRTRQKTSEKNSAESLIALKLKEADDQAYRARMEAERTFDEAEKKLSTSMAREGCLKAIQSWELHEKAISQSEKCIREIAR